MKRIVSILVLIFMISSLLTTVIGCREEIDKTPVYTDYKVVVTDSVGNPISQVMIKFVDSEGESKTRITDKDGLATLKNVLAGNYTVYVEQGYSTAIVTNGVYHLTETNTELNIILRDGDKTVDISAGSAHFDEAYAYLVGAQSYTAICNGSETAYFVFHAQTTGVYKISIPADSNATVGYYGGPHFVLADHCGEGEYDGKSFELEVQDVGTPYVIGINSSVNGTVLLNIERIGDAKDDPMYAPWTEITAESANFDKCDFTGKTLVDVDISDADFAVILGDDGFYYTADGKPVYIRITTMTSYGRINEEFQFVPVVSGSLALMAGFVDQNVAVNIGGYVYDEQGNFVDKYSYNGMIKSYMDLADATYGVVPMTAELAECIKLHGQANGWWNETSPGYIFEDINVAPSNAWLFLCMIEQ